MEPYFRIQVAALQAEQFYVLLGTVPGTVLFLASTGFTFYRVATGDVEI